jgi:hypothetical protein
MSTALSAAYYAQCNNQCLDVKETESGVAQIERLWGYQTPPTSPRRRHPPD